MGIPQIFIMPEVTSADEDVMGIIPGTIWKVFSDRIENNIYKYYDGKEVLEKAGFLDQFYVTNIRNGFLQIYSDPGSVLETGSFNNDAREIGWVKKTNVLLWKHSVLDSTTKNELQLLTYGTSGPLQMFDDEDYNDGVIIFLDPDLTIKSSKKTGSNQLYYAYKVTEKSILIGSDKRISGELDPEEIILGWVPLNYCFILSSRFWLSPNNDFDAIDERDKNNVYPSLFVDPSHAREYHYNNPIKSIFILWKDNENRSYPSTWFRFPIKQEKGTVTKVNIVQEDFKSAYTSETVKGLEFPVFKRVTLIGYDELTEVLYNMERVTDAANASNKRSNLQQTIVRLMSDEYQGLESEFIYNLTLSSVFENIFWICQSNEPIMKQKVRKLTDPHAISEDILTALLLEISEKEKNLNQIVLQDIDQHSFISNNNRYIWVDAEMFF